MANPQPPADPNQQPVNPYGGAAAPNQPVPPYGAPAPYPASPYPIYPPASMPAAPAQPMYPPTYPPQYAPPGAPAGMPPAAPSQPLYSPAYPPGYASPSIPLYQQPQQPYPYGMPPGMQLGMQPGIQPGAAGTMNFALLTQPRQRGFFIAAIAAAVLLIAFFALPFFGATVQVSGIPLISYAVLLIAFFALPFFGATVQVSGIPLIGSQNTPSIPPYGPVPAVTFAGSLAGWFWLVPLCALAAVGLAIWRAITPQTVPNGFNRRTVAIVTAAVGGGAILLLVIMLLGLDGYASTAMGIANTSTTIFGVSVGVSASGSLAWGYWIMLLAALGIGIGGVVQINTKP